MANPIESESWQNENTPEVGETADATKDSWESNSPSLKSDDRKKSGSYKRKEEQSGWGDAPQNKDSGGWAEGASSSNYEEVEKWGVTRPDTEKDASPDNNENKSDTGNLDQNAVNDDNSWGSTGDKDAGGDNWGPIDGQKDDKWDPIEEPENSRTTEWANNQQDEYQRRDHDNRPRERGRGGRRGGRESGHGRGGRDRARGRGRGYSSRDNFRRDDDYRGGHGYKSSSRGGGRNQNNEDRDSFNRNEKKEEDSKYISKKPGSIYESMHAPKSPKTDSESALKTNSTPYVNEQRVLSGGSLRSRPDEEELSRRIERLREQNKKIEEKRKLVEEEISIFKKEEEIRKKKELENSEIQRKKLEDEEEERKRHELQQKQLQQQIDEEREENAIRKSKNSDNREWDMDKKETERSNPRNQRNNSRGGNPYKNGSRDDYRDQDNNRNYDRRNQYNEYGGRGRGGRGRSDRGGDRGRRRGNRGGGHGGRRYSDHRDPPGSVEEGFGSGNSWAEQTEQQEKDDWNNNQNNQNNQSNADIDDNWGPRDEKVDPEWC